MQETLKKDFDEVDDPRSYRNQRHPFLTLVGTTFLSMLSGIDSYSGMQDFVEMHQEALAPYFDFPFGVPSHDTYQRFWDALAPSQFLNAFQEFTASLEKITSDIISLDGKTIRNSGEYKPLHIVSAWCRANQLVLAQQKVDTKSNEITAIPKLLSLLDLENRIITIDAMGSQRDICKQIIDQGGDYVISLKGNQSGLHQDVALYLQDEQHHELINENNDKGHWRLDVTFNEDKACIRNDNTAENIDILRKWALNGLQQVRENPTQSIKSLMRKNSMSVKHLISTVKKIFRA